MNRFITSTASFPVAY